MTNLNVPMTAQMSTQTTVRITQTKAGHNSRETTKTLSHLSTRVYTPKRTHRILVCMVLMQHNGTILALQKLQKQRKTLTLYLQLVVGLSATIASIMCR